MRLTTPAEKFAVKKKPAFGPQKRLPGAAGPITYNTLHDPEAYKPGYGDVAAVMRPGAEDFLTHGSLWT